MTMIFADRIEAGELLAKKLLKYHDADTVVYGLPRGGVATAAVVARVLEVPLDAIVTRKIGHPGNEEYAIAAVNEYGDEVFNEVSIPPSLAEWFSRAKDDALGEIARRKILFGSKDGPDVRGKIAIIIDDGIATGLTMLAAIRAIKRRGPKRIVVASPVAPPEVREMLERECDEVIILDGSPDFLGAVGAYYDSFPQLTDGKVIALLEGAHMGGIKG